MDEDEDERAPGARAQNSRTAAAPDAGMPPAPGEGALVPQPPPLPPSGAAPAERYNARLSRARSSNRLAIRSASSAKLETRDAVATGAPSEASAPSPAPAAAVPSIAPMGLLRRPPPQAKWSQQVADAMEAEIERSDCREMVRDITHAVLPTRQTVLGMGARGLNPLSTTSGEARGQQQEEVVEGEEQPPSFLRGRPTSSRLANVDEASSSNEASPVKRTPRTSPPTGAGASGPPKAHRGGVAQEQEWEEEEGEGDSADEDIEVQRIAMQAAIASGRADIVEQLLQGVGGPPAVPNGLLASGKSYLGLATSAGLYKVAAALLRHGADPNRADANGDSPLHLAVSVDSVPVTRLLLDSGAVSGVIDANGSTPLQMASSEPMKVLLLAAGMGEPLPPPPEMVGDGDEMEEGSEEEDGADYGGSMDSSEASRPTSSRGRESSEADGILTNANSNASGRGGRWHTKGDGSGAADTAGAAGNISGAGGGTAAAAGPPAVPSQALGDPAALPTSIARQALLAELQYMLNSKETDMKRLLCLPHGLRREVQCDVMRVGKSNTYRCYLRLSGSSDRRICVFEATRSRVGKLKNSQYRVTMPSADPRLLDPSAGSLDAEALDSALYCGKVRSYNLSGANFVVYDDGYKVENGEKVPEGAQPRRQLAALTFNKSSSRRVPMTMRVLTPSPGTTNASTDLLEALQVLHQALPIEERVEPPDETQLLKLVPPRWNADEQMFQLFCEGRACCMSNKNVQLANTASPHEAALQVGKLSNNMFNVDMRVTRLGPHACLGVSAHPAALSACPLGLPSRPALSACPLGLPSRPALSACPLGLPSRPALSACPLGLPPHSPARVAHSRRGVVSPFQAFCSALAVFDQSSVRRRF